MPAHQVSPTIGARWLDPLGTNLSDCKAAHSLHLVTSLKCLELQATYTVPLWSPWAWCLIKHRAINFGYHKDCRSNGTSNLCLLFVKTHFIKTAMRTTSQKQQIHQRYSWKHVVSHKLAFFVLQSELTRTLIGHILMPSTYTNISHNYY
jgi:hypothetical protein